jgi:hypothetical protein
MNIYGAHVEVSAYVAKIVRKVAETALVLTFTFAYSGYLAWMASGVSSVIFTRGEVIFIQAALIGVGAGTWLVCLYLIRTIWFGDKNKVPP